MPTDEMIRAVENLKITAKALNSKEARKAADDGSIEGLYNMTEDQKYRKFVKYLQSHKKEINLALLKKAKEYGLNV